MINFDNKKPLIEGVLIEDILKSCSTPLYIYSQDRITSKYNELKKSLCENIFFAVKANSNQAILKLINHLGAGADVVSIGELKRSLSAGFAPEKIIFEGVGKSSEDIQFAITANIKLINIESIDELNRINNVAHSMNKIVDVGIRLNPDIDNETIQKISTGKKSDKFGIEISKIGIIIDIIKESKNLNLIGISCHIGSQIRSLLTFKKIFAEMRKTAEILINNGINIKHIDLGGGINVKYKENDPDIDLSHIKLELDKNFKDSNYEISFEPGRYLVANAGVIATSVLTTKKNGQINYLITDAGMNTLIRPAMYNAYHKVEALNLLSDKKINYTIAGPICESSDIILKNIELPKQESGNILLIRDTGAYGAVMASNYNSRTLPSEVLVNKKSFFIIYKPKTIEEHINEDKIPDWLI